MRPVIKVWCLPKLEEEKLREIHRAIVAVAEESGLKGENSIIVLFPTDMMMYGLGEEIYIEGDGFPVPSVTKPIAYHLSVAIGEFFPAAHVQCIINQLDSSSFDDAAFFG